MAFQATNRYRHRRGREIDSIPPGFQRTEEVTIDPTTGVRMVVWYNEETGQRIYVPETKKKPS
ncbi:hypothetical protein AN477_19135 [Alicyclobacillus ferrooxydans]|uniref:Uncharacterized protein n=1 Tax=Alicyclobacillus ferrooxydans TaxID=471514 RepID=A0A0P9CGN9_9BACL|nr:hypothetical protein AN477_19135 [Alicyclobacillus ferrooxydans]